MTVVLNDEQQACVEAVDGVWVVVASPGSGKTTVLLDRYRNMLTRGINSRDILNLTFTAAAAEEMVSRAGLLNANRVFRTFHSFALELIKNERRHLPFKLCDTVIPVALEDYKLLFKLTDQYKAISNYKLLQEFISGWKRTNIEPEQAIEESGSDKEYFYALAYRDYERRCREEGWLDFDSLMRETNGLLETNATVRARYQWPYISVDEAQDTDIVQFRFLQLIFSGNIFVVGDENQLIYEWRSAQPGSLTNFERLFPGARKLYLGENFRSTGKLVEFFKEILPVDNGIASHMRTRNPEGEGPTFTRYFDDYSEASWIVDHISDPAHTAILARTNRQLFTYQKLMIRRGIKYVFLGKKDFWDQKEIKHMLSLAKDWTDNTRPAHEILTSIIRDHNLPALFRNFDVDNADPIGNMNDLVKIAAEKGGTIKDFLGFARRAMHGRKSNKKADRIAISTVHQAKGREWDHVYVIGVNQGRMPHRDGDLGEERRIFFVACSRAAKTLHISYNDIRSMFLNAYTDRIKVHTTRDTND